MRLFPRTLFSAFLALLLVCASAARAQNLLVNSFASDSTLSFDSYGIYGGVFATGQGLDNPACIAVSSDGAVLIGMQDAGGTGKVQRRAPDGSLQSELTAPGLTAPGGLALDSAGSLFVSDTAGNRVLRFAPDGSFQGVFASGGGLSSPRGLATDASGRLLVASKDSGQILRWNADGSFSGVFAEVPTPVDVKVGSGGNVYVLHESPSGGAVLERYPDGSLRCSRVGGISLGAPTGLALRPGDDAMFVTDSAKGVLFWDDSQGWQTLVPSGQSGLSQARGLAFQTPAASSKNSVNYQGRLADSTGAPFPDGSYTVTFALYAVESGGQPLWVSPPASVVTQGGIFTTVIPGVPETIFESAGVWLETRAGAVTLSPRQAFAAVPYAFQSRYAGALAQQNSPIVCAIGNVTALRLGADSSFWARATGGATFVTALDSNGVASSGVTLSPGSGSWSTLSDRAAKTDFQPVDTADILEKLALLPVGVWSYKGQGAGIRHMGPVAQDFRAAFGLGEDDRHISTVDADGVILAAIQGLYRTVQQNDERIRALEQQVREMLAQPSPSGEAGR